MKRSLKKIFGICIVTLIIIGAMIPVIASEKPMDSVVRGPYNLAGYLTDPGPDTTDSLPDTGIDPPPPHEDTLPSEPPWD